MLKWFWALRKLALLLVGRQVILEINNKNQKNKKQGQVGIWAGQMSLGTLTSRLLGFIRDILIAAFFSRTQTDIFFVAFRFPNFFRRFLGEGSFTASVTPALVESVEKATGGVGRDARSAKELSSLCFTALFALTSFLTVLGCFFMEEIMGLLFGQSAYSLVEGKLEQTVVVGRIVFVYLFLASSYSYFMSVAQAFGRFFVPALAPALFNVSLIIFACLPQHWWPFPSVSLAWAVIVGGCFQLFMVMVVIHSLGFLPNWRVDFKNKEFRSVIKRFIPAVVGLSGFSLIGLMNLYFAGWLQEGTHSYIYYGDRLLELPRSLIAISFGTALVPALSRLHVNQAYEEFKKTAVHYLNFLLFLTLPCAIVFYLLPEPIVRVLFERGSFDQEAVLNTTKVLKIYSFVLILSSLARIFSSCFFAINKNWQATIATFIYVISHGVFAFFLTQAYGLEGLVWSMVISTGFYLVSLMGLMAFQGVGFIPLQQTGWFCLKSIPGIVLFVGALLSYNFLHEAFLQVLHVWQAQFLALFLVLAIGFVLYIAAQLMLKQDVAYELIDLLKRIFVQKKARTDA